MRELTSHMVNGLNECIKIEVLDEPGSGGACHLYRMSGVQGPLGRHPIPTVEIQFQNGPINEAGANGLSQEALLAIDDASVWTGSCPCQPFSNAGRRKAQADERHLWPEMLRLIAACKPERVFGEQVASAVGHGWLDGVFADMEAQDYTCGAVVLGAHSVGAPHIRQRIWWVAESASAGPRPSGKEVEEPAIWRAKPRRESNGIAGRLGDPGRTGLEERVGNGRVQRRAAESGPWEAFELANCRDGKSRRFEPG